MLKVVVPEGSAAEWAWVTQVILGEHLGLAFSLQPAFTNEVRIESEGRTLAMPSVFFERARDRGLDPATLPQPPLPQWDTRDLVNPSCLADPIVPVIFGDTEFSATNENIRLPIDVFGSSFVLLSRYEELLPAEHDAHGRYPSTASLAFRGGFLHRPIVDEYTEVLWSAVRLLWPQVQRSTRDYRLFFSSDVDTPFDYSVRSPASAARRMVGDIVKRRSLAKAFDTAAYAWRRQRIGLQADRKWCFDWMMSLCEKANVRAAFYFLTDSRHPLDGIDYWHDPDIDRLLRNIHDRGHEIGLHTTYTTFDDPEQTRNEFDRLRDSCDRLGIQQARWGGRQHYLRWRAPQTWRNWDDAGLDYDSTLSFADRPGFRCGTCRPYSVFDAVERVPLDLIERPLVVMEASVLSPHYLGQDPDTGLATIQDLIRTTRRFGGEFGLLWHNIRLQEETDRRIFSAVLEASV